METPKKSEHKRPAQRSEQAANTETPKKSKQEHKTPAQHSDQGATGSSYKPQGSTPNQDKAAKINAVFQNSMDELKIMSDDVKSLQDAHNNFLVEICLLSIKVDDCLKKVEKHIQHFPREIQEEVNLIVENLKRSSKSRVAAKEAILIYVGLLAECNAEIDVLKCSQHDVKYMLVPKYLSETVKRVKEMYLPLKVELQKIITYSELVIVGFETHYEDYKKTFPPGCPKPGDVCDNLGESDAAGSASGSVCGVEGFAGESENQ